MRRQLHKECSRALQYYSLIMQEGCDLLGETREGLIPEDQREEILRHRKQELLAYAAYIRAQKRLWSLLTDSDPRLIRLPDVLPGDETSSERSSREHPKPTSEPGCNRTR
jgi:hypothetical protein